MIDSRDIKELHPCLQRGAAELIRRMNEKGYPVLITSTYRDYERQEALYAQGRTNSCKIVTNARGNYSNHNFRIAFDICKNVKGSEFNDAGFFKAAGAIWNEMGGVWGGDFKSIVDKPHFEYTGGLSTADMREGKRLRDDAKMKWEESQDAPQQPSSKPASSLPYKVRVTAISLNIRAGAGTNHSIKDSIRDRGIYSIVEESTGEGAKKWGKLLSGAGWIALDYTTRA